MQSEVYKIKVDTLDELLAGILDAAGCVKIREDQLRRTTHDLSTGIAKCPDVDGEIFEYLFCKINSNLSFFFAISSAFVSVDSSRSVSIAIQN